MTGHVLLGTVLFLAAAAVAARVIWVHRHPRGPGRHERAEIAADAEADSFVAELRGLPAPGLDIYTDRNVWLPRTPPAETDRAPVVASITDARPGWQHNHAERLATDTDVRAIAAVLPAWVIEALNGHDGVDAAVESIVARAVAP